MDHNRPSRPRLSFQDNDDRPSRQQQSFEEADAAWSDFFQAGGRTVPEQQQQQQQEQFRTSTTNNNAPGISSTSSSQERKRKNPGPSPERRAYHPHPPTQYHGGGRPLSGLPGAAGSSRDNAIDLMSPPRPIRQSSQPQQHTQPQQQQQQAYRLLSQMPRRMESSESLRTRAGVAGRGSSVNDNIRGGLHTLIMGREGEFGLSTGSNPNNSTTTNNNSILNNVVRTISTSPMVRRDSDIVLPRWQPDTEVKQCPVCHAGFSLFYRKHHCRKCGRVVCANCSPHRITIPQQYIVRPDGEEPAAAAVPTSPRLFARNLGGGEIVRVCNPCVPDPWTPEAAAAYTAEVAGRGGAGAQEERGVRRRASEHGQQQPQSQQQQRDRYRYPVPHASQTMDEARARALTQQIRHPPRSTSTRDSDWRGNAAGQLLQAPYSPTRHRPDLSSPSSHRHTQSTTVPTRLDPRYELPPAPYPPAPPPPPARREIPEEDECPVCGIELPPGEALRETHIQSCIASRFSTSGPTTTTTSSTSLPTHPFADPTTPSRHARDGSASPAPSTGATPPPQQRPRASTSTYRPRGMAVYRATEKDCVSADGEAVECVICFEEFQPGEELGRMECLCKFHRGCIQRWWEARGGLSGGWVGWSVRRISCMIRRDGGEELGGVGSGESVCGLRAAVRDGADAERVVEFAVWG